MNYNLRDAVRYISEKCGFVLTDGELTTLLAESGDAIEASGRAVRAAAQEYEDHVISLAAEMLARRSANTELEAPMDANQQRSN